MDIPNVKSNHKEKTIHPCQFPIELAERLILSMSKKNDLIIDPYASVGTTLLAAAKMIDYKGEYYEKMRYC